MSTSVTQLLDTTVISGSILMVKTCSVAPCPLYYAAGDGGILSSILCAVRFIRHMASRLYE